MISFSTLFSKIFENKKNYSTINWQKLIISFVVIVIFSILLQKVFHSIAVEYFEIKNYATEDVDFTDIYYYSHLDTLKEKKVVLINIGSLPSDSLRQKLTEIIPILNNYEPKAIGIDIYFSEEKDKQTDLKLDTLLNNPKITIGIDNVEKAYFPLQPNSKLNFGYINLTNKENQSVRECYNFHTINNPFAQKEYDQYDTINNISYSAENDSIGILSFPKRLALIAMGKSAHNCNPVVPTSYLRYTTIENGFYNALDESESKRYKNIKFPAIEANDVLLNPMELKNIIKNKIVILGWLGDKTMQNPYDIRDKHAVPVDFKLFNRQPTMPGSVIFANAVEMMTNHDTRINEIKEVKGFWFYLFTYGILFIYFVIFIKIEIIRPILLRLVVEVTFILLGLLFIIKLGLWFMEYGYHIRLGALLITIALLIEFKTFAFHFYDHLFKKNNSH